MPPPAEGTAEVAARVAAARQIQAARAAKAESGEGALRTLNARAEGRWLETIAALDEPGRALLTRAAEAGRLSARGWTRTLRLARTIADLEASPQVRHVHVAEALIYRRVAPAAEGMGEATASAYEM